EPKWGADKANWAAWVGVPGSWKAVFIGGGACVGDAGATTFSGAWVGGAYRVGSTVGPSPGGGVELEEARFGPLSRASSSAMLVAIWLTVPSRAAMRAWSFVAVEVGEAGGRGAPDVAGGGRCVGRALEYTGSTPAGVRGGGACACGG
ncbi:hypothetical protein CRG98_029984, partial [Punica granatum]